MHSIFKDIFPAESRSTLTAPMLIARHAYVTSPQSDLSDELATVEF